LVLIRGIVVVFLFFSGAEAWEAAAVAAQVETYTGDDDEDDDEDYGSLIRLSDERGIYD
jgi:hypothetical protein